MPIIHGSRPSPFVRKVLFVLEHKGIEYQLNPINAFKHKAEVLALNPLGKIPVYQEGDFILPDSSAICTYLEKLHPEPSLYPADPKDLARCAWYESYGSALFSPISKLFFHRVVGPKYLGREADQQSIDAGLQELPPMLAYLNQEIGEKEFLVGNQFSLADISIFTGFVNLRYAEHPIDRRAYPHLARYLARLTRHPSIAKVLAKEALPEPAAT